MVLCHRRGGGAALKTSDDEAVLGCHSCHGRLDGIESDLPDTYDNIFEEALKRTHRFWDYHKAEHNYPREGSYDYSVPWRGVD